ncbi:hypothetical protein SAMN05421594_1737 [Chryseobacterium oleae]|uniref:Uncharacterized protein n=1 Tax=Chryseobacterium oleae TaxID=491207 RepID=A0A1I4XCY5_CHROL|nr:hypothetical protein [Chryseobacterium oleae]SFN23764.1 hypothetical protein SAMN05421594_1737 [Chryseobacterium oleae]
MKKSKIHQTIQYTLVVLVTAILLGFTASCKGDDDDDTPARKSHKVVFKAIASAGSNIKTAVYGYDSTNTTATSLSGTTWTSPEITSPAGAINVNVGVNATGSSSASTLKVQIFVDGELKKEGTSSGEILSATANYTF